jgi:hypothetical protein
MVTSILNVKKLKFIYKKDRVRAMVFNVTFKFEFRKKRGLGIWCLTPNSNLNLETKKDRVMVFNASFKLEFRKKIGLGIWCLTLFSNLNLGTKKRKKMSIIFVV